MISGGHDEECFDDEYGRGKTRSMLRETYRRVGGAAAVELGEVFLQGNVRATCSEQGSRGGKANVAENDTTGGTRRRDVSVVVVLCERRETLGCRELLCA